jgi:hypothetical protein
MGEQLSWQYGCVPAHTDRSSARIEAADLFRLAALAADGEAGRPAESRWRNRVARRADTRANAHSCSNERGLPSLPQP